MAEKRRLSKHEAAKQLQPNVISKKPLTETVKKLSPAEQKELDTKLCKAAEKGRIEEVRRLLKAGADVNAKVEDVSCRGRTVLIFAAIEGHTETVKLLIENKADVNAKEKYGRTALMCAANNGHTETVKLLIENKADVNAKEKYGWTALIWAAKLDRIEIVKLLIDKNADVNAKVEEEHYNGYTALMCAPNNSQTKKFLKSVERLQAVFGNENFKQFMSKFRECVGGK